MRLLGPGKVSPLPLSGLLVEETRAMQNFVLGLQIVSGI